jgi:hypothetical protein
MTPAQAELLNRFRRTITDMQRQLEAMDDGRFTIRSNGEDITAQEREALCGRIQELEGLVEKHDPDGFTVLR